MLLQGSSVILFFWGWQGNAIPPPTQFDVETKIFSKCHTGFELDPLENMCVRAIVNMPVLVCSRNQKFENGACWEVNFYPAEKVCENENCELKCKSSDELFEGESCEVRTEGDFVWRCPEGTYDSTNESCLVLEKHAPQLECPDGFDKLTETEYANICAHVETI
eukprot:Trichotokara_eunicae@DN3966_c0_g1_i1.p1